MSPCGATRTRRSGASVRGGIAVRRFNGYGHGGVVRESSTTTGWRFTVWWVRRDFGNVGWLVYYRHGSWFTAHGSQSGAHGPCVTACGRRLTVQGLRCEAYGPRVAVHVSWFTGRGFGRRHVHGGADTGGIR